MGYFDQFEEVVDYQEPAQQTVQQPIQQPVQQVQKPIQQAQPKVQQPVQTQSVPVQNNNYFNQFEETVDNNVDTPTKPISFNRDANGNVTPVYEAKVEQNAPRFYDESTVGGRFKKTLNELKNGSSNFAQNIPNMAKDFFQSTWNGIGYGAKHPIKALNAAARGLGEGILEVPQDVWNAGLGLGDKIMYIANNNKNGKAADTLKLNYMDAIKANNNASYGEIDDEARAIYDLAGFMGIGGAAGKVGKLSKYSTKLAKAERAIQKAEKLNNVNRIEKLQEQKNKLEKLSKVENVANEVGHNFMSGYLYGNDADVGHALESGAGGVALGLGFKALGKGSKFAKDKAMNTKAGKAVSEGYQNTLKENPTLASSLATLNNMIGREAEGEVGKYQATQKNIFKEDVSDLGKEFLKNFKKEDNKTKEAYQEMNQKGYDEYAKNKEMETGELFRHEEPKTEETKSETNLNEDDLAFEKFVDESVKNGTLDKADVEKVRELYYKDKDKVIVDASSNTKSKNNSKELNNEKPNPEDYPDLGDYIDAVEKYEKSQQKQNNKSKKNIAKMQKEVSDATNKNTSKLNNNTEDLIGTLNQLNNNKRIRTKAEYNEAKNKKKNNVEDSTEGSIDTPNLNDNTSTGINTSVETKIANKGIEKTNAKESNTNNDVMLMKSKNNPQRAKKSKTKIKDNNINVEESNITRLEPGKAEGADSLYKFTKGEEDIYKKTNNSTKQSEDISNEQSQYDKGMHIENARYSSTNPEFMKWFDEYSKLDEVGKNKKLADTLKNLKTKEAREDFYEEFTRQVDGDVNRKRPRKVGDEMIDQSDVSEYENLTKAENEVGKATESEPVEEVGHYTKNIEAGDKFARQQIRAVKSSMNATDAYYSRLNSSLKKGQSNYDSLLKQIENSKEKDATKRYLYEKLNEAADKFNSAEHPYEITKREGLTFKDKQSQAIESLKEANASGDVEKGAKLIKDNGLKWKYLDEEGKKLLDEHYSQTYNNLKDELKAGDDRISKLESEIEELKQRGTYKSRREMWNKQDEIEAIREYQSQQVNKFKKVIDNQNFDPDKKRWFSFNRDTGRYEDTGLSVTRGSTTQTEQEKARREFGKYNKENTREYFWENKYSDETGLFDAEKALNNIDKMTRDEALHILGKYGKALDSQYTKLHGEVETSELPSQLHKRLKDIDSLDKGIANNNRSGNIEISNKDYAKYGENEDLKNYAKNYPNSKIVKEDFNAKGKGAFFDPNNGNIHINTGYKGIRSLDYHVYHEYKHSEQFRNKANRPAFRELTAINDKISSLKKKLGSKLNRLNAGVKNGSIRIRLNKNGSINKTDAKLIDQKFGEGTSNDYKDYRDARLESQNHRLETEADEYARRKTGTLESDNGGRPRDGRVDVNGNSVRGVELERKSSKNDVQNEKRIYEEEKVIEPKGKDKIPQKVELSDEQKLIKEIDKATEDIDNGFSIEVNKGVLSKQSEIEIKKRFGEKALQVYKEHVKKLNETPLNRVYSEDFDDIVKDHDTNNPNKALRETVEKAKGYHETMKAFAEQAEQAKIEFGIINENQAKNRLYQQSNTGNGIYTRTVYGKAKKGLGKSVSNYFKEAIGSNSGKDMNYNEGKIGSYGRKTKDGVPLKVDYDKSVRATLEDQSKALHTKNVILDIEKNHVRNINNKSLVEASKGYTPYNRKLLGYAFFNGKSKQWLKTMTKGTVEEKVKACGSQEQYNAIIDAIADSPETRTYSFEKEVPDVIINEMLDGHGETIKQLYDRYGNKKSLMHNAKFAGRIALAINDAAISQWKRGILTTASFFTNNRRGNQQMIYAHADTPQQYFKATLDAIKDTMKGQEKSIVPEELVENSFAKEVGMFQNKKAWIGIDWLDNTINLLQGHNLDVASMKTEKTVTNRIGLKDAKGKTYKQIQQRKEYKHNIKSIAASTANIVFGMPNRAFAHVAENIMNMNTRFENFERKQAYFMHMDKMRQNKLQSVGRRIIAQEEFIKHIDEHPEMREALIKSVEDTLGDYNNFSKAEKKVMKRVVPFYSWFRTVSRWNYQMAKKDPTRLALMYLNMYQAEQDDKDLKEYQRGGIRTNITNKRSGKKLTTKALTKPDVLESVKEMYEGANNIKKAVNGEIDENTKEPARVTMSNPIGEIGSVIASGKKNFINPEITNKRYYLSSYANDNLAPLLKDENGNKTNVSKRYIGQRLDDKYRTINTLTGLGLQPENEYKDNKDLSWLHRGYRDSKTHQWVLDKNGNRTNKAPMSVRFGYARKQGLGFAYPFMNSRLMTGIANELHNKNDKSYDADFGGYKHGDITEEIPPEIMEQYIKADRIARSRKYKAKHKKNK